MKLIIVVNLSFLRQDVGFLRATTAATGSSLSLFIFGI